MALAECINDEYVIMYEPTTSGMRAIFRAMPIKSDLIDFKVLEVHIVPTRANRLFKIGFQTCATVVQYVANISMGCLLAQTLYERLCTKNKRHKANGIVGVKEWEPIIQYQP